MTPAILTQLNITSVTTARGQQPSTSTINHNSTNKQDKETQLQLKLIDAHTGAVLHKFLPRQSLCKTVCYHNSSGSILQRYFSSINLFPNEVMLNINMLSESMVLRIVCKCNASLVVCKDGDRWELLVLAIQNLTEEEAKSNCFLSSLSECHILSFFGGQGHGGLFLASPGDWRLTSQKDVSTSAMARI